MDGGRAGPRGCRCDRSQRNAELGQGTGQLATGPEPSGDLQWLPEAGLAWRCVDDRPADRVRVEVLHDPPELLAWLGSDAGNGVTDRVPRAEGGLRRRGPERGRRLGNTGDIGAEQRCVQAGLPGEHRERALLSWFAFAGDDDRADQPEAGDAGL